MRRRRLIGCLRSREVQGPGANLLDNRAMLLVQAQFEGLLVAVVQWKQIKIVIGSAVEDAPLIVHRGIEEGVRHSAIFGLHVIRDISDF